MEAILGAIALADVEPSWAFTHCLPIPLCHEAVCARALEYGTEFVWLVEEDVVPPPSALVVMLEAIDGGADGAFIDYPIGSPGSTCNCAQTVGGRVVWCGTGCLLLRRSVLEQLPRPWFANRQEVQVRIDAHTGAVKEIREYGSAYEYGGQDIGFTLAMWQAGMTVAYVQPEQAFCEHLRVKATGPEQKNNGAHEIFALPYPVHWH